MILSDRTRKKSAFEDGKKAPLKTIVYTCSHDTRNKKHKTSQFRFKIMIVLMGFSEISMWSSGVDKNKIVSLAANKLSPFLQLSSGLQAE